MNSVKLERIVSCNSEDPKYPASNLLKFGTKWKSKSPGVTNAAVIVQLEEQTVIKSIDIGNEHSAFVHVLVGRATSDEFRTILPSASFMTPAESDQGINPNRVRMFSEDDFVEEIASEKWDRLKVVCSQPYNRRVQYGLSFIVVKGPELKPKAPDPGHFKLKASIDSGSGNAKNQPTNVKQDVVLDVKKPVARPNAPSPKVDTVRNKVDIPMKKNGNLAKANLSRDVPKPLTPNNKKPPQAKDIVKPSQSDAAKRHLPGAGKNQPRPKKPKPLVRKKPFSKLLEGVTIVISGYVNPGRAVVRSKALDMGAKYKQDWDSSCTHLICAFKNTPKFRQVQGQGCIVTKNWIEECHAKRKRIPWRRFALDSNDLKKPESEDEIEEAIPVASGSSTTAELSEDEADYANAPPSGSDTEEELEKIAKKKCAAMSSQVKVENSSVADEDPDYLCDTEDEDVSRPDTSHLSMPPLLN